MSHPVLVLDDVLPYGGQSGPFAVVSGSDRAAFVSLELAHWEQREARDVGGFEFLIGAYTVANVAQRQLSVCVSVCLLSGRITLNNQAINLNDQQKGGKSSLCCLKTLNKDDQMATTAERCGRCCSNGAKNRS